VAYLAVLGLDPLGVPDERGRPGSSVTIPEALGPVRDVVQRRLRSLGVEPPLPTGVIGDTSGPPHLRQGS
jgi:hypothetical protein